MKLFRAKATPPPPRRVTRSARPQAFSYHANRVEQDYNIGRSQPRDQDVRRHEQFVRFWRQRLSVLFMGALILICVGYILHLSPTPQIVPLTSNSADYVLQPASVYQTAASRALRSSWLNANKITVDTTRLSHSLKQQFPELAAVSVTLPLMGHRPIIYVSPKQPALILQEADTSYVIDTTGQVLDRATALGPTSRQQLPTVIDKSGLKLQPRADALPASSVTFISYVAQELRAKAVSIQSVTLPEKAYELDVRVAGKPYYVKFNLHDYQHAQAQVGTMLAVMKRLQEQGTTPSQYIDVRLAGRAYYK
ncbi:MAG TPA: hypothetical protein VFH39_01840 [Candidatus Saccharimonadales bacterium]|nr:hypothetical protein [Candidatus Saccharimonadales bacterium]